VEVLIRRLGDYYTGEIPYFFMNTKLLDRLWETPTLRWPAKPLLTCFNFASNADPNGSGLMQWPKTDPAQARTLELGERTGLMPLASKEKIKFWTSYFNSPASKNATPVLSDKL